MGKCSFLEYRKEMNPPFDQLTTVAFHTITLFCDRSYRKIFQLGGILPHPKTLY